MLRRVLALAAACLLALPVAAQTQRTFPQNALRGALVFGEAPDVALNGLPARLAPGSRIRDARNMMVVPSAVHGGKFLVHYTIDTYGLVKDVWILTAEEAAKKPWPTKPEEAAAWGFDPVAQVWGPALSKTAAGQPKVFIKTFGCQMNVYDSDKMADVLHAAAGYEPTDDVEEADLILFNTCSVREKAEEKVFSDLGRVKHLKARGALIGVGGCVASQEGAAIVKRAPYVDLVFGPQTLHRLPAMLARQKSEQRPQVDISFPEIEKFDHLPPARVEGPTAFVSIMEGCSKYCSYCVVPYTRGEEVSRPFDDVLAEVAGLADQGVREVTLLGQNVNAYRGAMGGTTEIADFAALLEVVAEIPGIERIRYTTSHPKEFTQSLVDVYGRVGKLVNHVHLPVQHGSDRILAAMKRGYTALEFKSTVRKLRAVRPEIAISSDFIVGFPGETGADFERTMALVEDVGFDHSFSFLYSPRPGTPAAQLADETGSEEKLERLQRLQARIEAQGNAISASRLGTTQRILVEGRSRKDGGEQMGRTECNRVVNFAAADDLAGRLIDVRITEVRGHSLRGEPVAA